MKRKNNYSVTVAQRGLSVVGLLYIILFMIGLYSDTQNVHCSGFMGSGTSCIESYTMWPFGILALPLAILFITILTVSYMSKDKIVKKKKG